MWNRTSRRFARLIATASVAATLMADTSPANAQLVSFVEELPQSGGGYTFNLSTKTLQPGRYDLRIKAGDDPTVLTTPVQVR